MEPPDAPRAKTDVTFSQANSQAVDLCLGCRSNTGYVRENSMYRAFALADYGVAGRLSIQRVRFGVCTTMTPEASGGQPLTVRIHGYSGTLGGDTLDVDHLTKYQETTILVPNTGPRTVDVSVDAELPATTTALVVELHVDDGLAQRRQLAFAANGQGERAPGYHRAADCSFPDPLVIPKTGNPGFNLILSAFGQW
jgi:hypothetical protein